MEKEFSKKAGLLTRDSVTDMIAGYVRDAETEDIHVTSCHGAVAWWIANEEQVKPTDDIVLLGPDQGTDSGADRVYHSILMRDDDIIGDTQNAQREIPSSYDSDTGEYTSKMYASSHDDITYYTVMRMSVEDFKSRYVQPENNADLGSQQSFDPE